MSPPIGSARAGFVSQVGDVIPDSAVAQYDATKAPSTGNITSIDDEINSNSLSGNASVISSGINGKQTFRFDGTERMDSSTPNINRELVVGMVMQYQNTTIKNSVIHGDDTDSNIFFQTNKDTNVYKSRTGTSTSGNTGGTVDNNPHIVFHKFKSGGGATVELDNTDIIDYSTGSASLDGFTLADRSSDDFSSQIDFGEVLLYDSPSTTDIDNERTRLKSKWGITF